MVSLHLLVPSRYTFKDFFPKNQYLLIILYDFNVKVIIQWQILKHELYLLIKEGRVMDQGLESINIRQ